MKLVPITDCAIPVSDLENVFPQFKAQVDQINTDTQWFYSINSFYKPKSGPERGIAGLPRALRKKWAASYLTCLFVDLDGYNIGLDFGALVGRIISLQDDGSFTPASVTSGLDAARGSIGSSRTDPKATDRPPRTRTAR